MFASPRFLRVAGLNLALAAGLAAGGCRHLPAAVSHQARAPLPAELAAQFSVAGPPLRCVRTNTLAESRSQTARRFEFLPPTEQFGNRPLLVDAHVPAGAGPWPVILILPISGSWYWVEPQLARSCAAAGFAAVVLHRRQTDKPPLTGVELNAMFRESILDARRVLDWMATRPEFDARRIGLFGASGGGIEAATLAPVDPRVRAAVLAFAAGDLAEVYASTLHWSHVRHRNAVLRERRITLEELKAEFRLTLTADPLRLAPYADPARVLMILARWDAAVPFKQGWQLREAMGSPETIVLPSSHVSSFFAAPYLQSQALDFFRRKLGPADTETAPPTPR